MAQMTLHHTFALDLYTVDTMRSLAKDLGVSLAELVRRGIHSLSKQQSQDVDARKKHIEEMQALARYILENEPFDAEALSDKMRAERHAEGEASEARLEKYWASAYPSAAL
jgi:hypothetical protein